MIAIKSVALSHRPHPGKTMHTIIDANGSRPFGRFVRLQIVIDDGEKAATAGSFYLMHICADGTGTDTWHQTLSEAMDQAEYEFGIKPAEWTDTNEPF